MPAGKTTGIDREFFAALGDVVFGNPFSRDRAAVIATLTGSSDADDREALARIVAPRLAALSRDAAPTLERFGAEDQRLLEPALLYVVYHRYVPQLDALIERQAKGGAPLTVPFAEEAIGALVASGFAQDRAVRLFSFYFQLRRAFYFILRSLTGECESMQRLREALWNNVVTHDMRGFEAALWNRMEDFSTLILGETGTGKGEAAAAMGRSQYIPYLPAERRFATSFAESFIALNLSQYAETLIESELFGHRKGAFTGAVDNHAGVLERCSPHGALFLDEIGEVPIPVQIKLLQVLQQRVFTPVGGHERKRFSGRVIAATNRPLEELRRQGRFRDDFYYRLCSDVIQVPTLRQRIAESPKELEQLVRVLVMRVAGAPSAELTEKVLAALAACLPKGYPWPGNVRELEQAVRRILLTGAYRAPAPGSANLDADDRLAADVREASLTADELLGRYCLQLYRRLGTYAEVAERVGLDPRTTRKYIEGAR
jgi:sigma-54 specific flagellar transcriptional regulator A